jgi:hypothetical protein
MVADLEKQASKILMNGGVIAIAVAAVCIFLFMPFRSTSPVTVRYLGTTNEPVAGPLFVMSVTNETAYEIRFGVLPPEVLSHGIWEPSYHLTSIRTTNLPAHSAGTFAVSSVPAGSTWCEPVVWAYDKSFAVEYARSFLIDNVRLNLRLLSEGQGLGLDGGNHIHFYRAYLPEMKN